MTTTRAVTKTNSTGPKEPRPLTKRKERGGGERTPSPEGWDPAKRTGPRGESRVHGTRPGEAPNVHLTGNISGDPIRHMPHVSATRVGGQGAGNEWPSKGRTQAAVSDSVQPGEEGPPK